MVDADSTDAYVNCEIPYIQSTQSLNTFHIDKPGVILGDRPIFSDVSLRDAAYDGKNFPIAENTGTDCYIGTRSQVIHLASWLVSWKKSNSSLIGSPTKLHISLT
jgi:hypothetical protein